MPSPDPAPLPYGALQYYQIHYIVEVDTDDNDEFLARCEPITKGHFGNKRVVAVRWTGAGHLADVLQNDAQLTEMLKEALLKEGEIRVDPLEDHVRIYGKWRHEYDFGFSQIMAEIADRIAMHIKAIKPSIPHHHSS